MIVKEIWRDIPLYENYQISNFGRIYSEFKKDFKTLEVNKKGYPIIRVYKNNIRKTFRIHRLVAETFIPNPNNKPQVNHIDGNKKNNHVSNLEWCTNKENAHHAYDNGLFAVGVSKKAAKMNDKKVLEARRLYSTGNYSYKEIADIYNIDSSNMRKIINKQAWRHVV